MSSCSRPSLMCLAVLLAAVVVPLPASALDKDDPFEMVAREPAGPVAPGATVKLEVEYRVFSDEFFIYRVRSEVGIDEPAGLEIGEATFPKGKVKFDKIEGAEMEIYGKTFVVALEGKVPAGAAAGEHLVKATGRLQGCNIPENYCLFPETADLAFKVIVSGDGPAAEGAGAGDGDGSTSEGDAPGVGDGATDGAPAAGGLAAGVETRTAPDHDGTAAAPACAGVAGSAGAGGAAMTDWATALIEGSTGGSFLFFLLLVFLGGIASSFTPCVYPMIPITVAVIGASGEQGRGRSFLMALVYVGGICATYTVLGFVVAQTGGLFGSLLQNPWVITGVAGVFVLLALAMFGLYEFALPSSVTTRASQAGGGGFLGAFIVGTVAGVVAAPCTGPVVAFLLLEIANSFTPFQGVLVMLAYSLGLGQLFLAVGTFSGALAAMPRSGAWMMEVKHLFGVLMVAVAVWYMDQVLPANVMPALWAIVAVLSAGVVAGWIDAIRGPRSPKRLAAAVLVLAIGLFLAFRPASEGPGLHVVWGDDEAAGLTAAATAGKPAILDFTADWCAACKELEHLTYTDPAVVACADEFETIMVDGTEATPVFNALRAKYGFQGLPAVYFLCPDGDVVENLTLKGFEPADRFLVKMNQAIKACGAEQTADARG